MDNTSVSEAEDSSSILDGATTYEMVYTTGYYWPVLGFPVFGFKPETNSCAAGLEYS